MIVIYGNNLDLITRYNNSLKNYEYKIIEDKETLLNEIKENNIVIISNINLDNNLELITQLINKNTKVIVLDPVPSYEEGKKLIALGIKAYANFMINDIHLKDVIQSVLENNIWLYPEFINKLVSNISTGSTSLDTKKEFEILTDREKEVALLVLNKMPYSTISETLDISLRTVKAHTKHIYEKFNVSNRLAFILKFS